MNPVNSAVKNVENVETVETAAILQAVSFV